jgi:DNA-binding MarR family transcriptional regulator
VSRTHEVKGKPVSLVLTAKGKKVFNGLFNAALDRDEVFLGALTAQERGRFDLMLNKIFAVARQVEKAERAASAEED